MYDRNADTAYAITVSYQGGYGGWRFNGARSAQSATSGRQIIGGATTRCTLLSRG